MCFLSACDGIEDSVNVLKINYELKRSVPEVFRNRDPLSAEIQQCLENQYYIEFPTTPDGFAVFFFGLKNSDSSNYILSETNKTFFMCLGLTNYDFKY